MLYRIESSLERQNCFLVIFLSVAFSFLIRIDGKPYSDVGNKDFICVLLPPPYSIIRQEFMMSSYI